MVDTFWLRVLPFFCLLVTSHGGCYIPPSWYGEWFQLGSGNPPSLSINSTHIESKGVCLESTEDKFVFYDKPENCYRCIVMHNRHKNVLQYKETYCIAVQGPIEVLCNEITGDAVLLYMFRMGAEGVPCPFKSPPYSVVYSKGHGDCSYPPSRAEPCTDDTRLVFRFQACPDIPGTESAVEELECLATWRDGSFHYLVGRLHHKMATSEEEKFRCFVYHKQDRVYQIAQSGEATCSGLLTPNEGSRNMKLTKIESQHSRCKFPTWVTQHYHWRSLDYSHSFHFSHRNASLKIAERGGATETKLMCHAVQYERNNLAKIVVHVISGCVGGYKCMILHKRDSHLIQMQQTVLSPDPNDICNSSSYESSSSSSTITMITGTLPTVKCPLEGRYSPGRVEVEPVTALTTDCSQDTSIHRLYMACSPPQDTMEFEPTCRTLPKTAYMCHGSWQENGTTYVVGSPVSRHSTDARHYCFILTHTNSGLTIERAGDTCAAKNKQTGWFFNITEIGKCSHSSSAPRPSIFSLITLPIVACFLLYQTLR